MIEHLTNDGPLLRRDAIERGIDDNTLGRWVRAGRIVRIRQGAYVRADVWDGADERTRHLLLATAVAQQYDDHVALSHSTAALLHGAPTWGLDLADVDVTHLSGNGRREAKIDHHHGRCGVQDLTRAEEHWITSPARTVIDTAGQVPVEAGIVLASDFLHRGLTTVDELEHFRSNAEGNPHSLRARTVLAVADERFESVGESRCRYLFWSEQLPPPIPQFEIFHPSGMLAGRVDFAWPDLKLIVEFDGRAKYHRYRKEGETIEEMVVREKDREDMLRELTGWMVIRIVWADLYNPRRTAARVRAQFRRASA